MATKLEIRVYNVLFGDAIYLKIPDVDAEGKPVIRRVMVDCGNALATAAGSDDVFRPVLENLRDDLNGAPLDLYIMTHEHMDHVQGMLYGASKLGITIKASTVWLTASSAPDYYARFDKAKKKRALMMVALEQIRSFLAAAPGDVPEGLGMLLAINNPRSTADCIDHIRSMSDQPPVYIHRTADIAGKHPFRKTGLRVMAPEEDTSDYYGRLAPRTLGLDGGDRPFATAVQGVTPPAGVSAGHFFDLVRFRSGGMLNNLLAIDKAANNTSIVLELSWQGWTILLPGDAEEKSWEIMERHGLLKPVDVLKISHHGSPNGSPEEIYDRVLPAERAKPGKKDRKGKKAAYTGNRIAIMSTAPGAYNGVPDERTAQHMAERARLYDTRTLKPGQFFSIELEPK